MSKSAFVQAIAIVSIVIGGTASLYAQAKAPPKPAAAVTPAPAVVPAGFTIGPEDVLGVIFWREPDMSGDVAVRPDGRITLPLLGELQAAGLTPELLRDQIQAAATKYLTDANVAVVVRIINSRKVYITGQVAKPEAYPLIGPRTVMQLIALAGGLTEFADEGNISVMRQEQGRTRVLKFNYEDVAKGKKPDIQLQPGDTVVVRE